MASVPCLVSRAPRRSLRVVCTIHQDIFSFPGGRRFHFLDPNGNELAVWTVE